MFPAVAGCLALMVTFAAWGSAVRAERRIANPSLKLLLVIIDGGDWDVAQPMLDRGQLPNLARAIESGSAGVLTSLRPMYSPIIYTSIASGKVADKHGIRGVEDHTSDAVLVRRVWNILGVALGWEYGTVEWHVTSPPQASRRGFMVPGWLATTNETIPPELSFLREIRRSGRASNAPGVSQAKVAMAAAWNGTRLSTLVDIAMIAVSRRFGAATPVSLNLRQHKVLVRILTEATRFQLRRTGVDMLAIAYTSTDGVSHRFWRYHEPEAFPGTDPESIERYGSAIEDMYAAVDEQLELLTRHLAPEGLLFILSDHGFQAVRQPYAEPRVLSAETLLQLVDVSPRDVTHVKQGAEVFLRPIAAEEAENSSMRVMLTRACSSLVLRDANSPALVVENVDRPGTGDDYVRVAPTEALLQAALSDGKVGAPGGAEVAASDLIRVFANTGWHALDGMIVMAGEPFKRGSRIEGASVLDVTPTILATLGLPIARDMDGTVIVEALTDGFLSAHPITAIDSYETQATQSRDPRAAEPLPEELQERLRALGYVD